MFVSDMQRQNKLTTVVYRKGLEGRKLEGSHNGIASVLKTDEVKLLKVRVLYSPQSLIEVNYLILYKNIVLLLPEITLGIFNICFCFISKRACSSVG